MKPFEKVVGPSQSSNKVRVYDVAVDRCAGLPVVKELIPKPRAVAPCMGLKGRVSLQRHHGRFSVSKVEATDDYTSEGYTVVSSCARRLKGVESPGGRVAACCQHGVGTRAV